MTTSAASAPLLTDGRVTLRRHTAADVDGIVEQSRDEHSQRWTAVARQYSRADAIAFLDHIAGEWENPAGKRFWAIEVTAADGRAQFGGTIDLRPGEAWDQASVGFGLHPAARGRGAMSRAVRLVAAHAFERGPWGRPLGRIHWRAITGNWASRRVAWSTGFTFHGTLPGMHPNLLDPSGPARDCWYASLAAGEPMHPRAPWLEPVVLQDRRIRLRAFRDSDVDALEERNDPEHWFPQRSLLHPDTFKVWLERRLELMASGSAIEWAIADAGTDRALGHLTVFVRNGTLTGDVAELGYQLVPSARGKGATKAACRLAIGYAFAPTEDGGLGLRRLVAETAADNVASNAVLRAVGFTEFGREHATDLLPDGTYGDGLHWELLS
ncbi:GNAT family N-acetyltransferase [Intrasporangium sp.]|jgi:RimJ/RimL family protein N-acetyltransferase|uniref:GNAT family N-acetyltransferase n=1 Tax=Intrasporangium sp. TaxID=1925024 RepID=UPI003365AE10